MIKLKKDLPNANAATLSLFDLTAYLKSISSSDSGPNTASGYARIKLNLAMQASQLRKKNASIQGGKNEESNVESPLEDKNSPGRISDESQPSSSVVLRSDTNDQREKLRIFLKEMETARKKNQLIYGVKEGSSDEETVPKRIGMGVSETPNCYKENLESTVTRGFSSEWAEFGISYDNKIFLNPTSIGLKQLSYAFNHQTMGIGTFLKAAGKIKIKAEREQESDEESETIRIYIASSSSALILEPNNSAIVLFVMKELNFPLANGNFFIQEKDKTFKKIEENYLANLLNDFPNAEKSAKTLELSVDDKLTELFLSIDDEILSSKKLSVIKAMETKKETLKANIISLLLLIRRTNRNEKANSEEETKQDIPEGNGNVDNQLGLAEEAIYECYNKIITILQDFKNDYAIDLSFVRNEISSWFYYLSTLKIQSENKIEAANENGFPSEAEDKDKKQDAAEIKLNLITAVLNIYKEQPAKIAGRVLSEQGNSKRFIQFYTESPLKTCILLLRNYTKGGVLQRLFTFAWNRHYISAVERFLAAYEAGEQADNLSINAVYQKLFNRQDDLTDYTGKKGTLYERLWFCSKLNGEMQESQNSRPLVSILTNPVPVDRHVLNINVAASSVKDDISHAPIKIEFSDETKSSEPSEPISIEKPNTNVNVQKGSVSFFIPSSNESSPNIKHVSDSEESQPELYLSSSPKM